MITTVLVLIKLLRVELLDFVLTAVDKNSFAAIILELACERLDIFSRENLWLSILLCSIEISRHFLHEIELKVLHDLRYPIFLKISSGMGELKVAGNFRPDALPTCIKVELLACIFVDFFQREEVKLSFCT